VIDNANFSRKCPQIVDSRHDKSDIFILGVARTAMSIWTDVPFGVGELRLSSPGYRSLRSLNPGKLQHRSAVR
jgi:hypothetical protein